MENGEKHQNNVEKLDIEGADDASQLKGYGVRHIQCLILFFCLSTAYAMRSCMGVALVAMIDDTSTKLTLVTDTNISISATDNITQKYFQDVISNVDRNDANVTKYIVANKTDDINADAEITTEGFVYYDIFNKANTSDPFKAENRTTNEDNVFKPHGFLGGLLLTEPQPRFKWKEVHRHYILSSFQWGYMVLQIPAGQLAHRFGGRFLLTGALAINCIVSFCTPWAAYYGGWVLTMICRITQGLSQACIIPSMHTLFGKWAPLEERARLAGFALGGQALGTVLGLPITGFIAASSLGWPGIFRFYGILSGIVAVVIWYMIANSPAQHPKISSEERRYIEDKLKQRDIGKKHLPVPWGKILRSRSLYAIVIAHIGATWGQVTLYTEVPAFMAKVMKVNIKANGLLTALPFLVMWFSNFFFSWITDWFIIKKILSVTNARKVANSLGCIPPAIGLVALAFVPKDLIYVESLLVIICAFKIAGHVGFQVNHIDISPNFAGTLMSLSNFMSNLVGSCAPITAGAIVSQDQTSEFLWRKVFFISAGMYFFTNLVYVIFGSGEQADWNDPPMKIDGDKIQDKEREPMLTPENGNADKRARE